MVLSPTPIALLHLRPENLREMVTHQSLNNRIRHSVERSNTFPSIATSTLSAAETYVRSLMVTIV